MERTLLSVAFDFDLQAGAPLLPGFGRRGAFCVRRQKRKGRFIKEPGMATSYFAASLAVEECTDRSLNAEFFFSRSGKLFS